MIETVSNEHLAQLRDVKTKKQVAELQHENTVLALALHYGLKQGDSINSDDGSIQRKEPTEVAPEANSQ
jgi:hypothetical protein